jgi:aspartate racemase
VKRIGVLGGISAQATMDFETRVHRVAQRLVPQDWNAGYPPMVVWYHRRLPVRVDDGGRPIVPMEIDPQLIDAAAWLGRGSDFLVVPCNAAHVGLPALTRAAGCPVLSMIEVTVDEARRRGWRRVGVLGFGGPPSVYVDAFRRDGVGCEAIDARAQAALDGGIRAIMEGRDGPAEVGAARAAVEALRARAVDGIVMGCTEIPLLMGEAGEAPDLLNPAALLAEAAVRLALDDATVRRDDAALRT